MGTRHAIPAVVTELNVNGLGVVRALGRRGVPVFGLATDPSGAAARSRYLAGTWPRVPGRPLPSLLLDRAPSLPGRAVLFPVTDLDVAEVAAAQETLERIFLLAQPEPDLARRLLDKGEFARLAGEMGLPLPASLFPEGHAEVAAAAVGFPCILKPRSRVAGFQEARARKAAIVRDRQELIAAYGLFSAHEPRAVVQEIVPGGDEEIFFCLHYFDRAGRPLASFTGRKLRQWPPLCGGTSACLPAAAAEPAALSRRFFGGLGYRGLASLELKRDPRDGSFRLIEPTVGRTDWQSGVAEANGVEIPFTAYCDLVGLAPPRPRRPLLPVKWVDLEADRWAAAAAREQGRGTLLRWLWSLRPPLRGAWFAWDDPAPWLFRLRSRP